jgi:hypothetical protein
MYILRTTRSVVPCSVPRGPTLAYFRRQTNGEMPNFAQDGAIQNTVRRECSIAESPNSINFCRLVKYCYLQSINRFLRTLCHVATNDVIIRLSAYRTRRGQ